MTIHEHYVSKETPLHRIRCQNINEHQRWHPDFDYHLYDETFSLEDAHAILCEVVERNGTHFQFRKWEFCGRDELIENDESYINKHTFVLCLQYPPEYVQGAPGCRHSVLVIADSQEVSEEEFINEVMEIEKQFDLISTYVGVG